MAITTITFNGIGVLIEFPDRLSAPLRRQSNGTWLQQDRGTFNWFHFTGATPVRENGADALLDRVDVVGTLDGATLDQVHIRQGTQLVWYKNEDVWGPQSGTFVLNYPRGTGFQNLRDGEGAPFATPGYHGYCISIRVSFTGSPGRISFGHTSLYYAIQD